MKVKLVMFALYALIGITLASLAIALFSTNDVGTSGIVDGVSRVITGNDASGQPLYRVTRTMTITPKAILSGLNVQIGIGEVQTVIQKENLITGLNPVSGNCKVLSVFTAPKDAKAIITLSKDGQIVAQNDPCNIGDFTLLDESRKTGWSWAYVPVGSYDETILLVWTQGDNGETQRAEYRRNFVVP